MSNVTKTPCRICMKLVTPDMLSSHIDSHSSGDMVHACPLCIRRFRGKCHLANHLKIWHRVVVPLSDLPESSSISPLLPLDMDHPSSSSQSANAFNFPEMSANTESTNVLRQCEVRIERCDHLIPFYARGTPMTPNRDGLGSNGMGIQEDANANKNPMNSDKETKENQQPVDLRTLVKMRETDDGTKMSECKECGKLFKTISEALRHVAIHTTYKAYKCPVCLKAFHWKQYLLIHSRVHSNQNPYKCTTCSKTFRFSSSLLYHNRIHSGQKPYECTTCSKTFRSRPNLSEHSRTHSEDRPFPCKHCPNRFKVGSNLKAHVKRFHQH